MKVDRALRSAGTRTLVGHKGLQKLIKVFRARGDPDFVEIIDEDESSISATAGAILDDAFMHQVPYSGASQRAWRASMRIGRSS